MTDEFLQHVKDQKKIRITYFDSDYAEHTCLCSPLTYGPQEDSSMKGDMFHLWDEESGEGNHILSLSPRQIITMVFTELKFHPSEFMLMN